MAAQQPSVIDLGALQKKLFAQLHEANQIEDQQIALLEDHEFKRGQKTPSPQRRGHIGRDFKSILGRIETNVPIMNLGILSRNFQSGRIDDKIRAMFNKLDIFTSDLKIIQVKREHIQTYTVLSEYLTGIRDSIDGLPTAIRKKYNGYNYQINAFGEALTHFKQKVEEVIEKAALANEDDDGDLKQRDEHHGNPTGAAAAAAADGADEEQRRIAAERKLKEEEARQRSLTAAGAAGLEPQPPANGANAGLGAGAVPTVGAAKVEIETKEWADMKASLATLTLQMATVFSRHNQIAATPAPVVPDTKMQDEMTELRRQLAAEKAAREELQRALAGLGIRLEDITALQTRHSALERAITTDRKTAAAAVATLERTVIANRNADRAEIAMLGRQVMANQARERNADRAEMITFGRRMMANQAAVAAATAATIDGLTETVTADRNAAAAAIAVVAADLVTARADAAAATDRVVNALIQDRIDITALDAAALADRNAAAAATAVVANAAAQDRRDIAALQAAALADRATVAGLAAVGAGAGAAEDHAAIVHLQRFVTDDHTILHQDHTALVELTARLTTAERTLATATEDKSLALAGLAKRMDQAEQTLATEALKIARDGKRLDQAGQTLDTLSQIAKIGPYPNKLG